MKEINLKLADIKYSLPKKIIKKCKNCFDDVNFYPQNYDKLVSKLGKKLNINKENILLINGIDGGIDLIAKVFGGNNLYFTPTYFEFSEASRRNNQKFKEINSFNGKEYSINIKNLAIKKADLIFLCNPNNPFGLLDREAISKIINKTNGIVAVDECYIDFDGQSAIGLTKKYKNLLILRSFSKGYSAAGLRLGFIIGNKNLIRKLQDKKLFFDVSSMSIEMGLVLLDEEKYFNGLIGEIKETKEEFQSFLENKNFNVINSNNNNIIIRMDSRKEADRFYSYLRKNNIIVNQGNGISTVGLDESWLRFACGTKEQMKKLKNIINKY